MVLSRQLLDRQYPLLPELKIEMASARTLKAVRQLHNFIGLLFAPTILFFAVTGGLQMFGLHETSRGSSYVPPALLMHLAQLHKKGTLYLPPTKGFGQTPPRAATPKVEARPVDNKPGAPEVSRPAPPNPLPIKIFFAAAATALVISTCTGIFMAWKYARKKSTVLLTLTGGLILPLVLLML